jgi:hypothetical protein
MHERPRRFACLRLDDAFDNRVQRRGAGAGGPTQTNLNVSAFVLQPTIVRGVIDDQIDRARQPPIHRLQCEHQLCRFILRGFERRAHGTLIEGARAGRLHRGRWLAPLLALSGALWLVGAFGVLIHAFLAAFNMLPFGPLDGATVRDWSLGVYVVTAVPCILLGVGGFLLI